MQRKIINPIRTETDIFDFLPILDYLPTNYRPLAPIIERELQIELSFSQMEHHIENDTLDNFKGITAKTIMGIISRVNKMIIYDVDGKGVIT